MKEDIEYIEALKKLKYYGQEQLLDRYKKIDEAKKKKIKNKIKKI